MKKILITAALISACLFIVVSSGYSTDTCLDCHKTIVISGPHKGINCTACHKKNIKHYGKNTTNFNDNMCINCHKNASGIMSSIMVKRTKEINIIKKAFDSVDENFYEKNCKSTCHVNSCLDCHTLKKSTHSIEKPGIDNCLKCHREYFTGIDYTGLAIREDSERYKRGVFKDKEYYLKMLPDVHYEKGLTCNECHSMKSLSDNKKYSKTCTDCHVKIDKTIVEHSIPEHLERLECYACHASWAVNELGSFYIQFIDSDVRKFYKSLKHLSGEYIKSAFIKEYGPPFLGINNRGKYSPVRAEFIFFYTGIYKNKLIGDDNRLLGAFWKAFYPHTVRVETVMCDNCHENRKKYLLLDNNTDIYELQKDDIPLESFYSSKKQTMLNGYFIDSKTFNNKINKKTTKYVENYIKKWAEFIKFLESVEEE